MTTVGERRMLSLEQRAHALLEANTQTASLAGRRYRFTVPSVRAYPFQWFWDSCFHAIVWTRFDWRRAADELRGLLAWQRPSGAIPHVVFWNQARVSPLSWHYLESAGPGTGVPFSRRPQTTALVQPPLIAQAVERVVLAGGDEFLTEALAPLERFYRYLACERDPDGDGLVSVISQFETGLDFSPAYDGTLARASGDPVSVAVGGRVRQLANKLAAFDLRIIFGAFRHHCEDVLFNAAYVDGLETLARLARRGGRIDLARCAAAAARRTTDALLERSYDERRGLFRNLTGRGERPSGPRTAQALVPLVCDLPLEVVARLVAHLTNPAEFWPRYPVPLVALDEPSFERTNRTLGVRLLSRGPSTLSLNWLIARGLRRHGLDDEAARLAERSRRLVAGGGFNEFFDPRTGRPVGAPDFGWATLAVDI